MIAQSGIDGRLTLVPPKTEKSRRTLVMPHPDRGAASRARKTSGRPTPLVWIKAARDWSRIRKPDLSRITALSNGLVHSVAAVHDEMALLEADEELLVNLQAKFPR